MRYMITWIVNWINRVSTVELYVHRVITIVVRNKSSNAKLHDTLHGFAYSTARNFWGRKLSQISRFCGYSWKFSLRHLGRGVLWRSKSKQSAKHFFHENRIFYQFTKVFSLESFLLYTHNLLHVPERNTLATCYLCNIIVEDPMCCLGNSYFFPVSQFEFLTRFQWY